MKDKLIIPYGWPCTLREATPGPFVTLDNPDLLCFKSEYHHDDNRVMAFNSAGEFFCSGDSKMVQPVEMIERERDAEI